MVRKMLESILYKMSLKVPTRFKYHGLLKQIIALISKENGDMWRQMVPGQV